MNIINKRTKIITTIGPASSSLEKIVALAEVGMTTVRLNFSHGTFSDEVKVINRVKQAEKKLQRPISVMLDTKGPEIRVGKLVNGLQKITSHQKIMLRSGKDDFSCFVGTNSEFAVSHEMHKDVKPGDKVLFDDGKLVSYVVKVGKNTVEVCTANGHVLKENKRINIPGVHFSLPFLSLKDKKDILFGIKHNVNYIAASFTNSADDVLEIRKILRENNASHIKVIPKIESVVGVKNVDSIIQVADGIMIARGDLGLEVPYEEVPIIQKHIVRQCRSLAKPVIVATQMLDSMETTPTPTRAEVTDVYFAASEGADCTMLSGESASGKFPVLSTATMSRIVMRAEREFYTQKFYQEQIKHLNAQKDLEPREKVALKVATEAVSGKYRFAIILSATGQTLAAVSKFRPNLAIIGILKNPQQVRLFGITSSVFIPFNGVDLYNKIRTTSLVAYKTLETYGACPGDKYIVVHRNAITYHTYGDK